MAFILHRGSLYDKVTSLSGMDLQWRTYDCRGVGVGWGWGGGGGGGCGGGWVGGGWWMGGGVWNKHGLLNLRALQFSCLNKTHIFQFVGKIWGEFKRVPLKLHRTYFIYDFHTVLKSKSSYILKPINVFEMSQDINTRPRHHTTPHTTRATSQYKDRLSQVWDSHVKDKTVSRPSYL